MRRRSLSAPLTCAVFVVLLFYLYNRPPAFHLKFAPGSSNHENSWPPVQKPRLKLPSTAAKDRDAVKTIFIESYAGYRRDAFGHDDLRPITKGFVDGRNGIHKLSSMHLT